MKDRAAGPGDMQDKILKQTGTPVTITKKEELLKIIEILTNALRKINNFISFRANATD